MQSSDWTPKQETRLSEFCKSNREILDGDFKGVSNSHCSSDLPNMKKNDMWSQICQGLNSVCGQKRTVDQMKCKWRQIRSNGIYGSCILGY